MYEFRLTVMSLAMMVNSMQARNLQIKKMVKSIILKLMYTQHPADAIQTALTQTQQHERNESLLDLSNVRPVRLW